MKYDDTFKYLVLGVDDYFQLSERAIDFVIIDFALKIASHELDYSYCSNQECKCNPVYRIKQLLQYPDVISYVNFIDNYFGSKAWAKMKELGWTE